jgi:dihydroorotate dehydrogenase (NAD+) catalytic subunit
LKNPVITASGTFGYGTEYAKLMDIASLGAIVTKGVTLRARQGNPQPRLAETPAGMLNTIGLQNPGVHTVIREKSAMWERLGTPVIVNISGDTADDYAQVAELLDSTKGVAAIEVNISCPNVKTGGMACGVNPDVASEVTAAVKAATSLPVIVKLTPNVTDVTLIARAVVDAGADAVALINTLMGMVIDTKCRRPYLSTGTGGLSGPAVRPVAVRMVYQVAAAVDVPIIGLGGVTSADDALQFLMAGATAVEVGTANFVNPRATMEIIAGLDQYVQDAGIASIHDIIGVANPNFKVRSL